MFDIHKNLSDEVIKNFGEDPQKQLDILQEECSELIQAISKYRRGKPNAREKIIEEMTHVLISSSVSAQLMGITQEDIFHEQRKKAFEYGVNIDELDDTHPFLKKDLVLPEDSQLSKSELKCFADSCVMRGQRGQIPVYDDAAGDVIKKCVEDGIDNLNPDWKETIMWAFERRE